MNGEDLFMNLQDFCFIFQVFCFKINNEGICTHKDLATLWSEVTDWCEFQVTFHAPEVFPFRIKEGSWQVHRLQ